MIESAVILAAGMGTRLKPLTDHSPKCLTEINRVPILVNALTILGELGIQNCTIVGGYFSEKIKSAIGEFFSGIRVRYLLNTHFASTNDMYSLWLARHLLEKGVVLLEGDIFFRRSTIQRALHTLEDRSGYLAGRYNGKQNEILISVDSDRRVGSIDVLRGRAGRIADRHYMSTGVLVVQRDYGCCLSGWLTEFVAGNRVDVLFDDVLGAHIGEKELYVCEVAQDEWVEVDTVEDVHEAERVFT